MFGPDCVALIERGWGYEVTNVDVMEAYDRPIDAATGLNKVDDVTEQIRRFAGPC